MGRRRAFVVVLAGGGAANPAYTVTIDNTGNASILTNYQIRVRLTSSNFDFSYSVDGSDIRFLDGVTKLAHYILRYDQSAQTADIWIKVPSIPASGTKTISLTTGNAAGSELPLNLSILNYTLGAPVTTGLAENMVFDSVTNKYYVIVTANFEGPIKLYSSATPNGSWTDEGIILNLGTAGQWDDASIYAPHLLKSGSTWYLFYSGGPDTTQNNHSIGVATSSSVLGPFTRYGSNPVITYSGAADWEQYRACEPFVYYSEILDKWVCWYMGDAGSGSGSQIETVGYATADDLLGPWTKAASNPIIPLGAFGQWDSGVVADPFAIEIGGVAYIGYTGGTSPAGGYSVGFVTTTDYITFTKLDQASFHDANKEWDDAVFRGALVEFGGVYYFPFTNTVGGVYKWGIATANSVWGTKGVNALGVFDFFDDFDGVALDTGVWTATGTGSSSVVNSVLTASTPNNLYTLLGSRLFGYGSALRAYTRHLDADGNANHATELGFSNVGRTMTVRIYDYNAPTWFKEAINGGVITSQAMSQSIDKNWHEHTVKRVSGTVRYQNDGNADESITTNLPTGNISPWLFVFAAGGAGITTRVEIDWIIVSKYSYPEPSVSLV